MQDFLSFRPQCVAVVLTSLCSCLRFIYSLSRRFVCVCLRSSFCLKQKTSLSVGILAKMKEGAENVHTKLQAKAESVGLKPSVFDGKG